ncbi:MAG TPA: hypothetical protein DDZ41_04290 [Flavobacterium sp.]|nr:hypothetical protein [Flavobacterium sp.]
MVSTFIKKAVAAAGIALAGHDIGQLFSSEEKQIVYPDIPLIPSTETHTDSFANQILLIIFGIILIIIAILMLIFYRRFKTPVNSKSKPSSSSRSA